MEIKIMHPIGQPLQTYINKLQSRAPKYKHQREKERTLPDAVQIILACHGNLHLHPEHVIILKNSFELNFGIKSSHTSRRSLLTAAVSPFFMASLKP